MNSVVVDTDVVSFLFKNDSRARLYDDHLAGALLVISFMSLAELDLWVLQRNWGEARRQRLETFLANFVIHPFDRGLCQLWAKVRHEANRAGTRIEAADAWIAATALYHGVPLVTHNATHFRRVLGLEVRSGAPA